MRSPIPERFALIRTIREGSQSRTFLANDHLLERERVVVKVIGKDLLHPDRHRLINDHSWAIGLQQSQFATVFDAGFTKEQHLYYVREYLPPSELFSTDPLPVMKHIVSAIDFLCAHHRVHGAIKASNIFVAGNSFKLTDSNSCGRRLFNDEESIHFTAPEILTGEGVTHEGDLYAAGAVLHRLLTGRYLFEDSDVNRLRSKYLSACPQPAPSSFSQAIFELVLQLLSRDPEKRALAFERLKRNLIPERLLADRAPFVGRAELLQRSVEKIQHPTKTVRVFLIEGEIGAGKSRFVTEMRLHCAFSARTFLTWQCKRYGDLTPVVDGLHTLVRSGAFSFRSELKLRLEGLAADLSELSTSNRKYPIEKTINDAIGIVACCAQRIPLVLAIEDIDFADPGTLLFIRQLVFRSSEFPLTLILTSVPHETDPNWIQTVDSCLGPDFARVCLPPLSEQESEELVQFHEKDPNRQGDILRLAAGNPFFIQEYAKSKISTKYGPTAVMEAVTSEVSKLETGTQALLQNLSVFRKAVDIDILAGMCDLSHSELATRLETVARLGFVTLNAETALIRLPILRTKLYMSLNNKTRTLLNRHVFLALQGLEPNVEVVSDYAFEAQMFVEAVSLYRKIAGQAYQSKKYHTALRYYERLRECCGRSGEVFTVSDRLNLARCYERTDKKRFSHQLYSELLSAKEVQSDPEMLSIVYTRLAITTAKISAKERSQFLDLAIQCLPQNSHHILRYAAVCNSFSRMGELSRASDVLKQMEAYTSCDTKNASVLNASRAILLLNTGDFRRATEALLRDRPNDLEEAALVSNLGFCLEYLGDLKKALKNQLRAREVAVASGNLISEIICSNNIAAILTKCGDMQEAGQLLNQSRNRIGAVTGGVNRDSLFLTVEADTAIHAICQGNYQIAHDCIKQIGIFPQSFFNIDRMFCEIIRCRFFVEIGLTERVKELLRTLEGFTIFSVNYLQVERVLLEAYIPEIALKRRIESLQHALRLSQNLGTLYQRCELLIAITAVHLESDEKHEAEKCVREALELADENGYRLLAARGSLLLGLASESTRDRQHYLSEALQLGSEMGLQEVIAESAFHLGIFHLESGITITAREYLIRSTSITARLADGVPLKARPKYMAKRWRREALRALDRCNESVPIYASAMFSADSDKYFAGIYQFTMAAAAANSVEAFLGVIEKTLQTCCSRSAVVILKTGTESRSIPVRIKISSEMTERMELIRNHAKNRVFFESRDEKRRQANAWIPLNSETCQGGLYVACRSHESPFSEKEIELLTMMGTIANSALRRLETRNAHDTEPKELSEFHGIIGASKPIREVYAQIQMAAGNAATVLIEGESGTGKELVAKAIHAAGPRAKEPFIAVDCGAIPETLIEAELFGSKKGSFTGAIADRPGLFEAAHRGTIFLDEISNTTPALQAKLLRIIQEREVRRIGETKGRSLDVRLIVASNQNLAVLAEAGHFRKDLLYRLKVLHIKVPSLRSRRDDIPMLAHIFLQRLNTSNKTRKYFASDVVNHLTTQKFPGNVRELQNAIERAFYLARGFMITEVPLEAHTPAHAGSGGSLVDEVQNWFRDISEGRKDFWSAIQNRYKHRDISREKVVALVDFGLRSTRGSYKTMASKFHLREKEYRRFMDFLRRNDCLLDFRPYRKAATASHEG